MVAEQAGGSLGRKGAEQPWPRPATAWYAVSVFALALIFLVLDRGIITLLVAPIKRDLHLTDTQMSLLLGVSVVIFYAFVGLPLSRLVDTKSRKVLLAAGIGVWSIATAICGLAHNFWQLFLCRFAVGAGDSINGPGTYSMLSDFFPPEKLPRAIAVLQVGFIGGLGLSLIIGAFVINLLANVPEYTLPIVGTVHSWQLVFVAVGLPGLIVVFLMATLPEPPRRGRLLEGPAKAVPVPEILRYLWRHGRVFGPMFIGLGMTSLYAGGLGQWNPTFFQRTYGWSPQQIGYVTGILALLAAPIGLPIGTWLNEHFTRTGRDDANLRVLVIAQCICLPFMIAAPLMPSPWLSVAFSFPIGVCAMMGAPSQNAALQVITPNEMRGQVTALYLFMFSVIGSGLGPTVIAVLTDYVFGENHIRYALVTCAVILQPLAVLTFWSGVKPYGREIARLRHEAARPHRS